MPACLPQGYFNGEGWEQRVRTPFCLVPSGSGNALAANCGLWTPETAAYACALPVPCIPGLQGSVLLGLSCWGPALLKSRLFWSMQKPMWCRVEA